MRLAVYGTVSTLAASGVVISAFAQRANFYSATVYLAQSNACLMILTNFSLLCSLILAHILQRILYGPLRDLEVESLYEKAWYAVTETCLAMTIFRDEWNVGFVLCFAGLLFAKGFCWLSSGRVEMMEQTPPANPRLFHTRLIASLLLLIGSDIAMVYYAVSDVLDAGKPGMMVMFAFEFTILLITALSTAGRYGLIMWEKFIVQKQANARRLVRQAERAAATAQAPGEGTTATVPATAPVLEDEEEEELDLVWEEKGTWMFYLELGTDFMKLLTYLGFFFIVLTFYGLPLHIIRDVYITLRSFISRIRDFIRYRRATNDMNTRYPDATVEEVERENVCIICREEMRPYIPTQENLPAQGVHAAAQAQQRQRMRPKKLPCGHILHFACLRSWLERQQRCPTCRRPVLESVPNANDPAAPQQQGGVPQQPGGRRGGGIAWRGQFGGIRVNFGVGQGPDFMQNLVQQWENRPAQEGNLGAREPAPPPEQQNTTERHQERQQGGSEALGAVEEAQPQIMNTTTTGLTNLRGLHIQCLELERRLRRELETVEALNTTIGNARDLRSRLNQARPQQPVPETNSATSNSSTNQSGTQNNTDLPESSNSTSPVTAPSLVVQGPQGVVVPPGWQVIPLTPVGLGTTSTTASSVSNSSGASVTISNANPLDGSIGRTFPNTLTDLRRRRFGRGDVRNYNANLRDYHAVRSPGVERRENEGGLDGIQASDQSVTQGAPSTSSVNEIPTNELQRRYRDILQGSLALDESTALMNAAARELQLAPSHSRVITAQSENLVELLNEDYVSQAENDMGNAFENRRAVLALVNRILDESTQILGQRRTGMAEAGATNLPSITSQFPETDTQDNTVGDNPKSDTSHSTAAQTESMTPPGSSTSSSLKSVMSSTYPLGEQEEVFAEAGSSSKGDKGKGKADITETEAAE